MPKLHVDLSAYSGGTRQRKIQTPDGAWLTEEVDFSDTKTVNGYVKAKSHIRGYIGVHRLKAEAALGRWLTGEEVVHHIDGNKTNNSKDNLLICRPAYHKRLHERCLRVHGSWHLPGES